MESSREKYLDFLREQVKYYKKYHWENDCLDENDLNEVFKIMKELMYKKDVENNSFMSILTNYLKKDYNLDFGFLYTMSNIINNISSQSEEIINEYNKSEDIKGDIIEAGWVDEFDLNVEELIENSSFCLDVEFGLPDEMNFEMVSIYCLFGNIYTEPAEGYNFDERILKNALVYLINQQGYSIKDIFDKILANEKIDYNRVPNFVESVKREIINNPNCSSALTACITVKGADICKLFDCYFKEEENLQINPSVRLGLFNESDGGGSLFEINIDSPFIIPFKYVRDIIIENAFNKNIYTVSDVYGIADTDFWSDDFSITVEEPVLKKETKEEIDEYIKKSIKGED